MQPRSLPRLPRLPRLLRAPREETRRKVYPHAAHAWYSHAGTTVSRSSSKKCLAPMISRTEGRLAVGRLGPPRSGLRSVDFTIHTRAPPLCTYITRLHHTRTNVITPLPMRLVSCEPVWEAAHITQKKPPTPLIPARGLMLEWYEQSGGRMLKA